jgi:hypothetical protein
VQGLQVFARGDLGVGSNNGRYDDRHWNTDDVVETQRRAPGGRGIEKLGGAKLEDKSRFLA